MRSTTLVSSTVGLLVVAAWLLEKPTADAQESAPPTAARPADANRKSADSQPDTKFDAATLKRYAEESSKIDLKTEDGVYLSATYWSPQRFSKDTPVVMLLHNRGRNQRDWYPFASYLRENGIAAITFDFRGHGESRQVDPTKYVTPKELAETLPKKQRDTGTRQPYVTRPPTNTRPSNATRPRNKALPSNATRPTRVVKSAARDPRPTVERIDQHDQFRNGHDTLYMLEDLRTVKRYLVEQNNAGRHNIRRLGIVGAGDMASTLALNFAEEEFRLAGDSGYQRIDGDLGAIVLINPVTNYKGLVAPTTFGSGADEVPVLLVSSAADERATPERLARLLRIGRAAEGTRRSTQSQPEATSRRVVRDSTNIRDPGADPELSRKAVATSPKQKRSPRPVVVTRTSATRPESVWIPLKTKLSGAALLRGPAVEKLDETLYGYLTNRLTGKKGYGWEVRSLEATPEGFGSGRTDR